MRYIRIYHIIRICWTTSAAAMYPPSNRAQAVFIHAPAHTQTHWRAQARTYRRKRTPPRTHTHTAHTHTHTQTHTHTHKHTQTLDFGK